MEMENIYAMCACSDVRWMDISEREAHPKLKQGTQCNASNTHNKHSVEHYNASMQANAPEHVWCALCSDTSIC